MSSQPFNSFAGVYYRKIQIYMKKAFKHLGISFDEGIVLINAFYNPGTTQDRIAENLALDTAAVARSLKMLEHKGYLSRVVDKSNQRRKLVYISQKGNEMADKISLAMLCWDNEILRGLDDKESADAIEHMRFFQERAFAVDISSVLDEWLEKDKD